MPTDSSAGVRSPVLLSGGLAGDVHDLELDSVGVVKEHRVVAGDVAVLLRLALDLGADRARPLGPLVDDRPRVGLEAEMVQADPVAVVLALARRLADPDPRARTAEVPDRLAVLSLDLVDAMPAERAEQIAVERQ